VLGEIGILCLIVGRWENKGSMKTEKRRIDRMQRSLLKRANLAVRAGRFAAGGSFQGGRCLGNRSRPPLSKKGLLDHNSTIEERDVKIKKPKNPT